MKLRSILVIVAALGWLPPAGAAVRVWQDAVVLPTYLEGPPDLVPVFDVFSPEQSWYPYASRTNLTNRREPQTWRRLNLENEYLACTFLPDLGGHLYTCVDKLNGHRLFRANPSVKKALIGVRGAWVSLGLEMSFPVAHSRVTVSPVRFGFRQEQDRASVWVGDVDRVTGMEWTVEFVLRTGRAVLEQNVELRNPTAVRQPYYWWNNAAIDLEPGTRFVIPTRLVAAHGLTQLDSWPVERDGVDHSLVANNKVAVDIFAHGSREPFLAAYHPGSRTATVHYADPAVVRGKKVWTWGLYDQNLLTELSDDNSMYVEIQAGLFENQDTFHFLDPGHAVRFSEYWMGARELGGVSRATLDAVLHLERRDAALVAELNVTRAIPDAHIRILDGQRAVLDERLALEPAKTLARSIPNPASGAHYRFELLDGSGKVLLVHNEGEYDAMAPAEVALGPQPRPDLSRSTTPDDYLFRGNYNELNSHYRFALGDYREGLAKFPESAALQKAAGRLAVVLMNYRRGLALLTEAAAALPGDREVHYYAGMAQAGLGDEEAARREWEQARQDPEFGRSATLAMAASQARSGQAAEALALVDQVLKGNGDLVPAGRMQVALLRKLGRADMAHEQVKHWHALDPLDVFLRVEDIRLGGADDGLSSQLGADPQRVFDVADGYMELGLWPDALEVLSRGYPRAPALETEPGATPPQDDPLVVYYRGYCRQKLGGSPADEFRAAATYPLAYVFPGRPSSYPVLRAAVAYQDEDASAHFLLGLLYMHSHMTDEALSEWRRAYSLRTTIPALAALLGRSLLELQKDAAGAVTVLRQGLEMEPSNGAVRDLLAAALKAAPAAPASAAGKTAAPATHPPDEIAALALLRAASGRLGEALGMFNGTNFPRDKEGNEVRGAYIELQLQRLRELAARKQCEPAARGLETLGDEDKRVPFTLYGFGAFMKGARFQYYLGEVEAACGDQKAARKRWSKVAKAAAEPESADFAFPALAQAALDGEQGRARLEAAAKEISRRLASAEEGRGILLYSQGLLLRAMGQNEKALAAFGEGAQAPDRRMSRYLNTLAMAQR